MTVDEIYRLLVEEKKYTYIFNLFRGSDNKALSLIDDIIIGEGKILKKGQNCYIVNKNKVIEISLYTSNKEHEIRAVYLCDVLLEIQVDVDNNGLRLCRDFSGKDYTVENG